MAASNTAQGAVYVVTGASRGLGLGLVTKLLEQGAIVVAAARSPDKAAELQRLSAAYPESLILVALDVSSEESIKDAAASITASLPQHRGVDVLINNAGIQGTDYASMFSSFPDTPATALSGAFQTNVVGPYLVARELLPLLRKGQLKRIVNISTGLASINDVATAAAKPEPNPMMAAAMAYRVSKAALNMETALMANNLKDEGFIVAALSPGWVQTDMGSSGAKLAGMPQAPVTVDESVAGQLKTIQALTAADNGQFLDFADTKWTW